jgi:hypothetical protein
MARTGGGETGVGQAQDQRLALGEGHVCQLQLQAGDGLQNSKRAGMRACVRGGVEGRGSMLSTGVGTFKLPCIEAMIDYS